MVTVVGKVVSTKTAIFSPKDIEDAIRDRIIQYNGEKWRECIITVSRQEMPVSMGQIDPQYEIVAKCVLTTVIEGEHQ